MNVAEEGIYTISEYLEIVETREGRAEYHDGLIIPLEGETKRHSRINGNLIVMFFELLKNLDCQHYSINLKLLIEKYNSFYYPDCMIICHNQGKGSDILEKNPSVILEVLSENTEYYDCGKKLESYRSIPSLQAYLLVSQYEPKVEIYARTPHGEFWKYQSIHGLEGVVEVESLNLKLKLAEIYESISFDK